MSTKNSKQPVVPTAREALDKFKMEAANDLEVTYHYNCIGGDPHKSNKEKR